MLTMMTALRVSPTTPDTMLAARRITTSGFARRPRPVRSRRKRLPVSMRLGPNSASWRAASAAVSPCSVRLSCGDANLIAAGTITRNQR
jgi:hypothetical protein